MAFKLHIYQRQLGYRLHEFINGWMALTIKISIIIVK